MANSLQPYALWDELEAEHRAWLAPFNIQYTRNWEKLLKSDYEAGLCEAAVRRLLQRHAVAVEPNEDLTGSMQTPDYRCRHSETQFFVEVACISIDKATRETGLPHPSQPGARHYRPLNDAVFKVCKGKASQCAAVDAPALVAVGTFHTWASTTCISRWFGDMLLTGEASVNFMIDTRIGQRVGVPFQTTNLYSAPFLRPEGPQEIREARASISGILLCGFGVVPPNVMGVLHPAAARPFDRQVLPGIEFGEVQVNRADGHLLTFWPAGDDA